MKKTCLSLSVAVVIIMACQKTPEPAPVDLAAEEAVISVLFDKFDSAFFARDVVALAAFLTEDALCLGTAPSEYMSKKQITDTWTQLFLSDSAVELNYISERKIKIAADGNSASVVDQYFMPGISPKIPWRNSYHLVKTSDNWKIDFLSCSFIPENEDIAKLNEALE